MEKEPLRLSEEDLKLLEAVLGQPRENIEELMKMFELDE